jgi:nitroreductase
MNPIFLKRRSGRSYDPARKVSREDLKTILEAARWAPSCYGEEPWRFIICEKGKEAYDKVLGTLAPPNQKWAGNAPILIIVAACSTFSKTQKPNDWAAHDTGAASVSLCLQAADLGLMTHEMGGFDGTRVKETFDLPVDCTPMAVIALGYEAKDAPDKNAPRTRKPLSENFFEGVWGKGIEF